MCLAGTPQVVTAMLGGDIQTDGPRLWQLPRPLGKLRAIGVNQRAARWCNRPLADLGGT
jgi:hypothetical protein